MVEQLGAMCRAAANVSIATANHTAEKKGAFTLALSGGSTPKALSSLLTTDRDLHARVPLQRHVPPDHPGSNHRAELLDPSTF
jgi:6-phosphogluconolactonase/glucosamine-6-phosphate isomerase/deaminase